MIIISTKSIHKSDVVILTLLFFLTYKQVYNNNKNGLVLAFIYLGFVSKGNLDNIFY